MKVSRTSIALFMLMSSSIAQSKIVGLNFAAGVHKGKVEKFKKGDFNSSSARSSIYMPITEVFSWGLGIGTEVFNTKSMAFSGEDFLVKQTAKKIVANDISLEFAAALPKSILEGSVSPYLKVGKTMWSQYKYRGSMQVFYTESDFSYKGTHDGFNLAVGSTYEVDKQLSLTAELQHSRKKRHARTKIKLNQWYEHHGLKDQTISNGISIGMTLRV